MQLTDLPVARTYFCPLAAASSLFCIVLRSPLTHHTAFSSHCLLTRPINTATGTNYKFVKHGLQIVEGHQHNVRMLAGWTDKTLVYFKSVIVSGELDVRQAGVHSISTGSKTRLLRSAALVK